MLEWLRVHADPNFFLNTMFDHVDLRGVHYFASLIGFFMAVYVMQLWTVGTLAVTNDCWITRHARRMSLGLLSLTFLWSLAYSDMKNWSPWPTDVAMILVIDLFLGSSIIVAVKKMRAKVSTVA